MSIHSSQPSAFNNYDLHLYPLYLKWAANKFNEGKLSEGISFFKRICGDNSTFEHKVYKNLWDLRGRPEGDSEYGRKAFYGLNGPINPEDNVKAITRVLRKTDKNELDMRENQIHKCLWIIHGRPQGDNEYGKHAFDDTGGRAASIDDKLLAAQMYAEESMAFTWLTEKYEVRLIKRADGGLELLKINRDTGKRSAEYSADPSDSSREAALAFFRECDIGQIDEDSTDFSPATPYAYWPNPLLFNKGTLELNLCIRGSNLIWRLFDKITNTSSWIWADNNSLEAANSLQGFAADKRKDALKNFIISAIFEPLAPRLLNVFINKIVSQSQLDPTQNIDLDNWAITLISSGGSSRIKNYEDPWFGHAQIIYEGVKNGERFAKLADLVMSQENSDYAHARKITIGEPEYKFKTPTWIRHREYIELMENQIKDDKIKFIPFNITGNPLLSEVYWRNLLTMIPRGIATAWKAGWERGLNSITEAEKLQILDKFKQDNQEVFDRLKNERNCLLYDIEQFKLAGIELPPVETALAIPNDYVKFVASNPSLVKLTN